VWLGVVAGGRESMIVRLRVQKSRKGGEGRKKPGRTNGKKMGKKKKDGEIKRALKRPIRKRDGGGAILPSGTKGRLQKEEMRFGSKQR